MDAGAERLGRDVARLEELDRLDECGRDPAYVLRRVIGVAPVGRARIDPVLDAVETGGDGRGVGEVRVAVGAGDTALDPAILFTTDDAECARAVVLAPHQRRRRPRPEL